MSGMRKTGLTPNESNIRLGLTPGGLTNFGFGSNLVPGLSTPGALLNGPITPGLSSLLGITQTPLSLLVPTTSSFLQNNQSHLIQPAANTSVGPIPESTALGSHVNIPQANQLQQDQSSQTLVGGLPPSQPQPQPQPVIAQQIHTIPENQSIAFDMTQPAVANAHLPESKPDLSETANLQRDLNPTAATTTTNTTTATKKRKNDTASGTNKKAKVAKGKKKEPKSKSKGKNNQEDDQNASNKPEDENVPGNENGIEENRKVEAESKEEHLQNGNETTTTKTNNTGNSSNGTTTTTTTKSKSKKNSNVSEDDKRKNFLERNRVAASKCRQRKKLLIQKMEEELEFYSNGYRELSAEVNELRGAILLLKEKHNIQDEIIDGLLLKPTTVPTNVTSIPSTIPTTLNPT